MHIQWPLVFFTLLTGLGAGAFSCVAITDWLGIAQSIRVPGAVTALVAMAAGGVASVFHLSHPLRTYNILKHLNTGVGKEMLLLGLTSFLIFLYLVMLGIGSADQTRRIVALIALISGVVLAFETGAIYILPARPAWNTWFWPFVYAASAAVTGLFAVYIWAAALEGRVGEGFVMAMNKAAFTALTVHAGTILAYLIFLKDAPHPDPMRRPTRLLIGDSALPFWGGVVLAGLLIPLALTLWLQASLTAAFIGFVCVLIGGATIRALMFTLGSEADPVL
jgi:anaerobic dimethyl sulfoxide reductase subunit C (anchor subunit)